jgi:two-component system LytT family sensor kinase
VLDSPPLPSEQYLLSTLVVQLAVVAVLATMLVRFRRFREILLTEKRDWPERLVFAAAFGIPLMAGVVARLVLRYDAADLTLAGPFIAGLIAGPYAGAIVGFLVGLPATLAGEVMAIAFNVGCGFAGGGLREVCPKQAIWHFSPFVFTGLHRYAWRFLRRFQIDWQVMLIAAPVLLELIRQFLGMRFGMRLDEAGQQLRPLLFHLGNNTPFVTALVVLTTVLSVAIPIKIWNSARIEHKLQEQEQLLMAARIQALASQINPHFLFNTLNSIGSLIRSQPDTARMLIVRLSALLRRLLKSQDQFVTLREELSAIDEYLDIECVRFGSRLRVVKDIDPASLDLMVPSLILQPLVENSLKHGLAPKLGDGELTIRSRVERNHAIIEVIDNGLGMPQERLDTARQGDNGAGQGGIGLNNVNERLRVIYGQNYRLQLQSVPGHGTRARLEIPELVVNERASA